MTSKGKIVRELKNVVGKEWVITDSEVIRLYARDASGLEGEALAVVIPGSTEEVSKIVRLCYANNIPIFTQGASSGLAGAAVPHDGIVLSMARFNKIIDINPIDSYVIVEAGVTLEDLNIELRDKKLLFPIDPSSAKAATVGGAINTNAGGMRGAKYGTMRDWVLGLEVVIPDSEGTILNLGGVLEKCRHGYDLVKLIVGSEGTLAIVTKGILKITVAPSNVIRIASYFNSIDDLINAILELKMKGVKPLIMEFIENNTAQLISKVTGLRIEKGHVLIMDLEVEPEAVNRIVNDCTKILSSSGAIKTMIATDPESKERLYAIRRAFSPTAISTAMRELEKKPTAKFLSLTEDITVPPSRLREAVENIIKLTSDLNIPLLLAGHIGDGNLHPRTWIDLSTEEGLEKSKRYLEGLTEIAIRLGGCVSGEHGIGELKKKALKMALEARGSSKAIDLMRGIKKVFDPKNILNPGKIID